MTHSEAAAFAGSHINLIGRKINFGGATCIVLKLFVVDNGSDGFQVQVLLSKPDGVETAVRLDRFLTDYELFLPIIVE